MLRILIIEDEVGVRKDLTGLLQLRNDIVLIGEASNITSAKTLIDSTQPDVVLLDIQLEDGNAFDLLSKFSVFNFKIIFITAYDSFAIKAIRTGALDYLLKPVDMDELFAALDRAIHLKDHSLAEQLKHTVNNLHHTKPDKLIIRTNEAIHIIAHREIMYCKSEGTYTYFHLTDGRTIIASKPLKEYEEILPEDDFVRCHQSYLVRLDNVIKIDREDHLVLRNGNTIPVATRRKEAVLQMISK